MENEYPSRFVEADTLSLAQVRERVEFMRGVVRVALQPGVHYGEMPGAGGKPALWKSGAEQLLLACHVTHDLEIVDLSIDDMIRYRILCRGLHRSTGAPLGVGVGECSSREEKYAWRRIIAAAEWDESPDADRRTKWQRGAGGKPVAVKQVRRDHFDVSNTVLKMAKKRALVDMALTVCAASDVFSQDLDDEPAGPAEDVREKEGAATAIDDAAPASDATLSFTEFAATEQQRRDLADFAQQIGAPVGSAQWQAAMQKYGAPCDLTSLTSEWAIILIEKMKARLAERASK